MAQMDMVATLRANVSNFTSGMTKATKAMQGVKKETSTLKGVGKALSGLGTGLTLGVTVPLAGMVGAAVKVGSEFDAQMSRVQAIAGATSDELAQMRDQAIDLGASTSFSAGEVAAGMENMASAGFTTNQIMGAMPGILDLAAVSGGDVALAAEAAASTINQFGLEASDAGHIADVFARAAADTNAETQDMAQAMKYAGPMANALGLSVEETAASIGILSDAGIKGSQAGTTLRGALTRLANPTKKAQDVMDELGLSFFDAQGNMLPMNEIIGMLESKMGGLTQEQKAAALATIFGQEAMSGMLALVDAGPDKLSSLTQSLEDSKGAAKDMAAVILDNLQGSLEEMGGALETAAINISTILSPVIRDIVDRITELINKFNQLTPAQQGNILKWVGIAAAAGPVLLVLGKIIGVIAAVVSGFMAVAGAVTAGMQAFAQGATVMSAVKAGMLALSGPVGWITAAIVALIAVGVALWMNWDTIKAKASELGAWISDTWSSIVDWTKTAWAAIKADISASVQNAVTVVSEWWNQLKTWTSETWASIKEGASAAWEGIKTAISNAVQGAVTAVSTWWTNLVTATQNTWTAIKEGAAAAWNGLVQGITNVVMAIVTFVQTGWNNLITVTQTIMTAVSNTIQTVWTAIQTYFTSVVTAITNVVTTYFGNLPGTLGNIWNSIVTIAQNVWEIIKQVFVGAALLILQLVTGRFEDLKSSAVQIWNNIKQAAVNIWNAIKTGIANVASAIVQVAVGYFNLLKDTVIRIWEQLKSSASSAWNSMKTTVSNVANTIRTSVVNAFNQLRTSAVNTWNNLKTSISNTINNIKTSAINGFNTLRTNVTNTINNLKQGAINAFNNLRTGAINAVNNLKTSAINGFNNLRTSAANAINNLKTSVVNGFNNARTSAINAVNTLKTNVVNGFRSMVTSAGNFIRQLPGKIRSGFSQAISAARGFISNAVSVGKDLVSGFIRGVAQKGKALVDKVTGVVDSAISGAKKLLGIKSPSKVFAYFGRMTDEGFGKGITQYARRAVKPVASLAKDVTKAFNPEVPEFTADLDKRLARSTAQVSSTVQHEFEDGYKKKPATINLRLGGQTFTAFVEDISAEQGRIVDLDQAF